MIAAPSSRRIRTTPRRAITITTKRKARATPPDAQHRGRAASAFLPLPGLIEDRELAQKRVYVARELGQEAHLMPSAAIAFRHQDGVEQDRNDEALRIVDLGEGAKPV